MARYIDADRLCKVFCSHCCDDEGRGKEYCEDLKNGGCFDLKLIKHTPTADVRENVHAHWEGADKYGNRRCSNCKSVEHVPTLMGKPIVWDFCPDCGAEMAERREDG